MLLAVTGRPYEEALLAAFGRPGSRVRVARRCLDLVDLLAVAGTGTAAVAVVSSELHRLDRESLARLAGHGVTVVAVVEPAGPADRAADRMTDLGVVATVDAPASTDVRATATFAAEVASRALAAHPRPAADHAAHDAGPSAVVPPAGPGGPPDRPAGRLVAVWGPTGAPGRTTVAVGLADELTRLGGAVLLADADTYGPSVAQRLGVLDEASGMAAAARAANAGELDPVSLASSARTLPGGLRVLTGLTRADRWPELPVAALGNVWRVARTVAEVTVVDCGFCLEEDDELAFDSVPARRNAATLTSLAAADAVVVVGGADPVGLGRLLRGMHELGDLEERRPGSVPAARHVVVNRVRPGAVGRRQPRRQIVALLHQDAGPGAGLPTPVLVPDDPAACDRAMASGRTLADAAPRSPLLAALAGLATAVRRGLEAQAPA